jgi:WD40 repeat protein
MTDAAFSPDGSLLAVASELGPAQVWKTASWKPEATLSGFLLSTHSVGFSPDGKRLAVSSDAKEAVKLWETESWQEVLTLPGEGSLFHRATFSPDGNTIGVLNGHGILHLWHAPPWQEIAAAEVREKAEAVQQ